MKAMKKSVYLLFAVLLIASVASCTTFKLSGIQITREIPSYQTVGVQNARGLFLSGKGGARW